MKWNPILLGELESQGDINLQTGPFGTQLKASDYTEHGTPVINVRNIGFGNLREEKLEYVPENVVERLEKHLLQEGDIVFGRKGAVDRHLLVKEGQSSWMQGSDCIRLRVQSKKITSNFLSYWFLLGSHKNWMLTQCSNKATMASLNQDVIKRIPVSLPDIDVQNKIADILSRYDEAIANNRRRIELLERSSRLLYREWFVHLRYPGHEHGAIGSDGIPEGWEKKSLSELAEYRYGYTASARHEPDDAKFLRITDIVPETIDWQSVPYCSISDTEYKKFSLEKNDVVVARTGATVGYAKRIGKVNYPLVFASYLVRFRFNNELSGTIASIFMESEMYKDFVRNNAGGAAQPNANAQILSSANILVPPKSLQDIFCEIVEPINDQKELLQAQNQKLQSARDLLLPRLMNGEINV